MPGNLAQSEMIQRISSARPIQMPPPDSHKALSPSDKQTLKLWIAQGAEYKPHWAFVKPLRPALPAVRLKTWPKNDIDYFVLAKLEKLG